MDLDTQQPKASQPPLPHSFLDESLIPTPLNTEARSRMSTWIKDQAATPIMPSSGSLAFVPGLTLLSNEIRRELQENSHHLLSLNPSRRESLVAYLYKIGGISGQPTSSEDLRKWVEGPRTPAQEHAIKMYLEELALISLGQVLLLKAWSDRGIRKWSKNDLKDLNFAMSSALKPFVPMDREGWQITRPNLYSWYSQKLSPGIQDLIWSTVNSWCIRDDSPELLPELLRLIRKRTPEWPEINGFDDKIFQVIWKVLPRLGFKLPEPKPFQSPLIKRKTVFTPTLRDGAMLRSAPASMSPHLSWIALESYPFALMIAELSHLWSAPQSPPLFATGTGLEVHSREQLQLQWNSPKPTLLTKITEMEACDLAVVTEERCIRTQGRSLETQEFRARVDALPYFRKLRVTGTSLGTLQSCVAMSKLRPGGLLLWIRNEPLTAEEGQEALHFFLDRSRLLCHWDFSGLAQGYRSTKKPVPIHAYLFSRELDIGIRRGHRPTLIHVRGQYQTPAQAESAFSEALSAFDPSLQLLDLAQTPASSDQTTWKIDRRLSPFSQQEWAERWPDATTEITHHAMDQLRENSLPLGHFVTLRPLQQQFRHPQAQENQPWQWPNGLKGFWLSHEFSEGENRLVAHPSTTTVESGYMVIVNQDLWSPTLSHYLESSLVRSWLDFSCERKGARWLLKESSLKYIPLPKALVAALKDSSYLGPKLARTQMTEADIASLRETLKRLPHDANGARTRADLYIQATQGLSSLKAAQDRLADHVDLATGQVRWRGILGILPESERIAFQLHTEISMSGSLPPQLPIARIERVKSPSPGFLLTTERGMYLHVASRNPQILEMLADQLEGLSHPTWTELTQMIMLPRQTEFAHSAANDILRQYGIDQNRHKELSALLTAIVQGLVTAPPNSLD